MILFLIKFINTSFSSFVQKKLKILDYNFMIQIFFGKSLIKVSDSKKITVIILLWINIIKISWNI